MSAAEGEALARVRGLMDLTLPFVVRAAASLGVADHFDAGPRTAAELAARCGCDGPPLRRLLGALATGGLVVESEPDTFALTPAGELLRSDHPFSLRDAYPAPGPEVAAWAALDHSLRTGTSAFAHVHGHDHYAHRLRHPDEDARMDRSHRAATRVEAVALSRLYDWGAVGCVVDVGGGTGALLAALLRAYGRLRGVLFDLPQLVPAAEAFVAAAGVADRCQVVGGDFFDGVPAGGDVYVLKAVLGGWRDEEAVRILGSVRTAMARDSRLLILEPILGYGEEFTFGNIVHLETLVLYGGPDRTRDDYDRLFAAAGLSLVRIVPRATLPILELRVAQP